MRDLLLFVVGVLGAVVGYLVISATMGLIRIVGSPDRHSSAGPYREVGVMAEPRPPKLTLLGFLKHLHDESHGDAYVGTLAAMTIGTIILTIAVLVFTYNVIALCLGHD